MGDRTGIEWTRGDDGLPGATWTPVRARHRATGKVGWHCEHASPGCAHCYSESFNERRLGTGLPFKPGHRADVELFLDETMLLTPLRWRRPRKIFVCSMTDLFGDWVPDAWIDRIFAVMALAPQHTFQVLTKRSARMRAYVSAARAHPVGLEAMDLTLHEMARNPRSDVGRGCILQGDICHLKVWPLPNVWLGVSAEDQRRADERVPDLLATPAAVRFLSAEPLLGPVSLEEAWHGESALDAECWSDCRWCEKGYPPLHNCQCGLGNSEKGRSGLDWIIAGGESGSDARPMHPDWVRALRDQCGAAGVPFLFKQCGVWGPYVRGTYRSEGGMMLMGGLTRGEQVRLDRERAVQIWDDGSTNHVMAPADESEIMLPIGKKAAGRLLDGVVHDGMPASSPPSLDRMGAAP